MIFHLNGKSGGVDLKRYLLMHVAALLAGVLAGYPPSVARGDEPPGAAGQARERVIDMRAASYKFEPKKISVPAGVPVTLKIINESTIVPHNLVISAPDGKIVLKQELRKGRETVVKVPPLSEGTYAFYCDKSLLGMFAHRKKGMEGTIEVTAGHAETLPDFGKALSTADWSRMETTIVTLSEYAFSPSALVFKEGVPAKLVLRNEGKADHYFTASQFFKSIATRKAQSSDGEIKAPYLTAVEVYKGKALEIFFVPLVKGTYDLVCTMPGHADKGMKGTIEIR